MTCLESAINMEQTNMDFKKGDDLGKRPSQYFVVGSSQWIVAL